MENDVILPDLRRRVLMRGKYEGEYTIYAVRSQLLEDNPGSKIWRWTKDHPTKYEVGDWLEAEDGWILIILQKNVYKNKDGNQSYMFRTPICSLLAYERHKNAEDIKYRKFLGGYSPLAIGQIQSKTAVAKYADFDIHEAEARIFAALVINGTGVLSAYRQAIWSKNKYNMHESKRTLLERIMKLLTHPIVTEEMKDHLIQFNRTLQNTPEFSDEAMIEYIKEFISHVRKGSMVHLHSIPFLLELLNKIPPKERKSSASKLEELPEIPYSEVKPPV